MRKKPTHGGARRGAGRPRKPPPPPPRAPEKLAAMLDDARKYAEAGVEEPTILAVLGARYGFDEAQLKAGGHLTVFRQVVALGLEVCRAELIVQTKQRTLKTKKNDGSVNALALRARNLLGWDRQSLQDEQKPDLSGARERMRFTLEKLARNKSAELGKEVSAERVLLDDLYPREAAS